MSQPSTQMPNMGTQAAAPVTRMAQQVKTAIVANKWKSLFGILFVVGVVVVLFLIFIPGAPIHKLIWPSATVKFLVPPNDSTQPPVSVLIAVPSMRGDGNYGLVVNKYKAENSFGSERNTAIVIVGNFMGEQRIGGDSPQAFDDAKLYRILTAATVDDAIKVIKT